MESNSEPMDSVSSPTPKSPPVRRVLLFKRLSENGRAPTRATPGAAGWDLYSADDCEIEPGKRKLVQLDLSLKFPKGTYGRIAPRSGLGLKFGIQVGAGVIDSDYVGSIAVLLFNFGEKTFKIRKGDRIAQLILEKISTTTKIKEVKEMPDTERGSGGFGSTGV